MRILLENKNGDHDYYCFCTSAEMDRLVHGEILEGIVYLEHFNRATKTFFQPQIHLKIHVVPDPATPEYRGKEHLMLLPRSGFTCFSNNYSVGFRYDFSGNKIQIMDVEHCPYPLCKRDQEIAEEEKRMVR